MRLSCIVIAINCGLLKFLLICLFHTKFLFKICCWTDKVSLRLTCMLGYPLERCRILSKHQYPDWRIIRDNSLFYGCAHNTKIKEKLDCKNVRSDFD